MESTNSTGCRQTRANENTRVGSQGILDTTFDDLESMFMARCPVCRPRSGNWSDNDRTPMKCEIITSEPSETRSSTPRDALKRSLGCDTLQFRCKLCGESCGSILLHDSPHTLYHDLRKYVCHDVSLPLMFDPEREQVDIPSDAQRCCTLAHKFPAEKYLTNDVLSKIELSLAAGALNEALCEKMLEAEFWYDDPVKSCIRIGVVLQELGEVTAVLELWPSGHSSPKHQHAGCAGSMRLVHGNLRMKLYQTLHSERAMEIPGVTGDDGIIEMQAPSTTWLDSSNWYVHAVESPQRSASVNPRGFALSIHVYLSCTDEFAFIADPRGAGSEAGAETTEVAAGTASSAASTSSLSSTATITPPDWKNPPNDLVWVIPGISDNDPRQKGIALFGEQVLGRESVDKATKKMPYIRAVEQNPEDSRAWANLAYHCKGGRIHGATYTKKACYLQALKLDPQDAHAWNSLGVVLSGGDGVTVNGAAYTKKACFLQALKLDPQYAYAWHSLGTVLSGDDSVTVNGATYTERDCFLQALKLDPQDADAWNGLGTVLRRDDSVTVNGAAYSKKACYLQALKFDPQHPCAQHNLQWLSEREAQ